jgi:hypothetical protein
MKGNVLFIVSIAVFAPSILYGGENPAGLIQSGGPGSRVSSITVTGASWEDTEDKDGDLYTQSRKMVFSVMNTGATELLHAKIMIRRDGETYYGEYKKVPEFTASSSSTHPTSVDVSVGLHSGEQLDHGIYDFAVAVYKSGSNFATATLLPEGDKRLNNQKFEKPIEDLYYFAYIYWYAINPGDYGPDLDGDGYLQYRSLLIDPNYYNNDPCTVTAKIFYKPSTSDSYTFYREKTFPIFDGTIGDNVVLTVGNLGSFKPALPHGLYDFKVELHQSSDDALVATAWPDEAIQNQLNDIQFETEAEDQGGKTGIDGQVQIPNAFELRQNTPNPFNAETWLSFQLPRETEVLIEIYDSSGRRVRTLVRESRQAGFYRVVWDGKSDMGESLNSGVYLYVLKGAGPVLIRKAVLLK